MGKIDQMKLALQAQKAMKELKKELVEVEAGDGAVVAQINGELKIKSLKFDEKLIDGDFSKLEKWTIAAISDGMEEAKKMMEEKMRPFMGALKDLGLGQ